MSLIPLVLLSAALSGGSARAWNASASDVERRLAEPPRFTPDPRAPRPAWTLRVNRPEERVHWSETFRGKTYVFGVGLARGIDNLAMGAIVAEDRARASLVERVGPTKSERATTSDGAILTVTTAVVNGARMADWYLDPSGDLYALAVLEQ